MGFPESRVYNQLLYTVFFFWNSGLRGEMHFAFGIVLHAGWRAVRAAPVILVSHRSLVEVSNTNEEGTLDPCEISCSCVCISVSFLPSMLYASPLINAIHPCS